MSNRAGGNAYTPTQVRHGDPEHIRDVALLQQAHAKVLARIRAKAAAGEEHRALSAIAAILRGQLEMLAKRPWTTASANVRGICLRALGLTELPPRPGGAAPRGAPGAPQGGCWVTLTSNCTTSAKRPTE